MKIRSEDQELASRGLSSDANPCIIVSFRLQDHSTLYTR